MSDLDFRRAHLSDLPMIIAMLADDALGQQRERVSDPPDRAYTDAFQAIDQDPNQSLIVVERAGTIVGCLQLSFIPGLSRMGLWRGQIESVRIASSARGGGLGRAMMDWAVQQCRDKGCGLVQLTSDKLRPDAIRFYEDLGFRASHEGLKLEL
jgi:ribosomal protein S18 acetylase RimI-like enzyme